MGETVRARWSFSGCCRLLLRIMTRYNGAHCTVIKWCSAPCLQSRVPCHHFSHFHSHEFENRDSNHSSNRWNMCTCLCLHLYVGPKLLETSLSLSLDWILWLCYLVNENHRMKLIPTDCLSLSQSGICTAGSSLQNTVVAFESQPFQSLSH